MPGPRGAAAAVVAAATAAARNESSRRFRAWAPGRPPLRPSAASSASLRGDGEARTGAPTDLPVGVGPSGAPVGSDSADVTAGLGLSKLLQQVDESIDREWAKCRCSVFVTT